MSGPVILLIRLTWTVLAGRYQRRVLRRLTQATGGRQLLRGFPHLFEKVM